MAGSNKCLKGVFIGVNVLYMLLVLAMIIFATWIHLEIEKLLGSQDNTSMTLSLASLWVFGIGMSVAITVIIYRVAEETRVSIIMFVTAHTSLLFNMIMAGSFAAKSKKMLKGLMDQRTNQWTICDTQMVFCLTLAAFEVIIIILGVLILRQLNRGK